MTENPIFIAAFSFLSIGMSQMITYFKWIFVLLQSKEFEKKKKLFFGVKIKLFF